MGIELIFVVIWLLIIFFGGNKKNKARGLVMDLAKQIGSDLQAAQTRGSETSSARHGNEHQGARENEKEVRRIQDETTHREHRATPWRDDLEGRAPTAKRTVQPLEGLSLEETVSHRAQLDPSRDAPKNAATKQRKLLGAGSVREAYLFKELIDKPVALRD